MNITNQELLELSTQIERQGQIFYETLSKHITDPEIKEFIALMAREETLHEQQFKKLIDSKGDQSFGWENSQPLRGIINQYIETDLFPSADEVFEHLPEFEGIQKAMDFASNAETVSAEFYRLLQEACTDLETKTLIVLLEKAEQEHLKRIETIKKKYSLDS